MIVRTERVERVVTNAFSVTDPWLAVAGIVPYGEDEYLDSVRWCGRSAEGHEYEVTVVRLSEPTPTP